MLECRGVIIMRRRGWGSYCDTRPFVFLSPPIYLRQQVVIEVQGQSRFSWGLMPGSAVLFHEHRLNFQKFDARVNMNSLCLTQNSVEYFN